MPPSTAAVPDEWVDVVDFEDNVIGRKRRNELVDGVDRWRITTVWVLNTSGTHTLLGQRAHTKLHYPGLWGAAVAGTVVAGEDYRTAARRETFEELGFDIGDEPNEIRRAANPEGELRVVADFLHRTDLEAHQINWDRKEFADMAWFDLAELVHVVMSYPELYVGDTPVVLPVICRHSRM